MLSSSSSRYLALAAAARSSVVATRQPQVSAVAARNFASEKGKKNKTGGNKGNNKFRLQLVYSPFELDEEDPDIADVVSFDKFNISQIQQKLAREMGDNNVEAYKNLEVYRNEEWEPLTSESQVKHSKNNKPIPVRVPELYMDDEEEYNEEDDDDYPPFNDDTSTDVAIKSVVQQLIRQFQQEGLELHGTAIVKDGQHVNVKRLVLEASFVDNELQDVLVSKIGALDHIATCLSFPFLWNETDEDGSDVDVHSDEYDFMDEYGDESGDDSDDDVQEGEYKGKE